MYCHRNTGSGLLRCGQGRNRTADTRLFRPLLYRLSYLSKKFLNSANGQNDAHLFRIPTCSRNPFITTFSTKKRCEGISHRVQSTKLFAESQRALLQLTRILLSDITHNLFTGVHGDNLAGNEVAILVREQHNSFGDIIRCCET